MTIERPHLSIIVPIGPSDSAWQTLLPQLGIFAGTSEIILALSAKESRSDEIFKGVTTRQLTICRAQTGRGGQMNAAADIARGNVLWFLHADSQLSSPIGKHVSAGFAELQKGLFYFDLKYRKDGPGLCTLNAFAANIRSKIFGLPFGDQGFVIERELFLDLGGYPTDCDSGEDHLFVWKVRRAGYPVRSLGTPLYSSARKYREHGWLRVTVTHIRLFLQQLHTEKFVRENTCPVKAPESAP